MANYFYCAQVLGTSTAYSGVVEINAETVTPETYQILKDKVIESAVEASLKSGKPTDKRSWIVTNLNKI